jgi:hypothetical protein
MTDIAYILNNMIPHQVPKQIRMLVRRIIMHNGWWLVTIRTIIHGQYVCKNANDFDTCNLIKKNCVRKILKIIIRFQWWKSYYRWNGMHKINDRFLHNHWFVWCFHWPDISQSTQTVHKSWVAGRKSNFSRKKCGRHHTES